MPFVKYSEWFKKRENILALVIVLVVLITHLAIIDRVEEPIYDGIGWVTEGNLINHFWGDEIDERWINWLAFEGFYPLDVYIEKAYFQHAPLSKLFIAAGIKIFGDNPWGWRIFPVLFGTISIVLFYLICQRLTPHRWLPLAATFIFAFENMRFVMHSIAMLDPIAFTFMLASFLVYLRGNYIGAGLLLAIAGLAKTMMALGGGVILVHWFLTRRKSNMEGIKFLVTAPLAYMLLRPLLDYLALRKFVYPWDSIYYWFESTGGAASWTNLSPDYLAKYHAIHPWEWVFNPGAHMVWPDPSYEITASWTLWALIIPAVGYASYEAIRHRWDSFCLFALLWFVWLYLPWFIVDFCLHKLSYAFHYYPVVGAVCLAAGYGVWKLLSIASGWKNRKVGWVIAAPAVMWMMAHFALFWVMAPVH